MHRSDTQYRYRLRYGHFLPDRVSIRWDRSKSDIVRILFCVIVKPHERHKNIIKHHKVFVHNIPSVLKLFHSLMWGRDEYLSQVQVNSSLRCVCLSSSVQHSDCVPRSVTTVKTVKLFVPLCIGTFHIIILLKAQWKIINSLSCSVLSIICCCLHYGAIHLKEMSFNFIVYIYI